MVQMGTFSAAMFELGIDNALILNPLKGRQFAIKGGFCKGTGYLWESCAQTVG